MTEEWNTARLIPVSGMGSSVEAESRTTSALLAVISAVRPFSNALLDDLGASKAQRAKVETFTEVQFEWNGKRVRPDGVIRVTHGSKIWSALVEVKTGDNELTAEQINTYLDVARTNGFDVVITVSNQLAPRKGEHPISGLKIRSNSSVKASHYSWTYVLCAALMQKRCQRIEDPEQAWILGELIRYLEHPASGASSFNDMGSNWCDVRDAVRDGSLNKRDSSAYDVVGRWIQLMRYTSLRLGAEIGEEVNTLWSRKRKTDASRRASELVELLYSSGTLEGGLRVPNTVGDLEIEADIRARQITASIEIDAPSDRGARGKVSWLLSQLSDASERSIVEAWVKNNRAPISAATISEIRENRKAIIPDGLEPDKFRVVLRNEMGMTRKSSERRKSVSFIDSVLSLVDEFYKTIMQNLKSWTPSAPRMAVAEPLRDWRKDVGTINLTPPTDYATFSPVLTRPDWWVE